MNAPSVVKVECECGTLMRFRETGSGSISASCPECKSQRFYKSSKAVNAFNAKYRIGTGGTPIEKPADAPIDKPADKPAAKSFLEEL